MIRGTARCAPDLSAPLRACSPRSPVRKDGPKASACNHVVGSLVHQVPCRGAAQGTETTRAAVTLSICQSCDLMLVWTRPRVILGQLAHDVEKACNHVLLPCALWVGKGLSRKRGDSGFRRGLGLDQECDAARRIAMTLASTCTVSCAEAGLKAAGAGG